MSMLARLMTCFHVINNNQVAGRMAKTDSKTRIRPINNCNVMARRPECPRDSGNKKNWNGKLALRIHYFSPRGSQIVDQEMGTLGNSKK